MINYGSNTTKTTVTVREYDEQGRLVKETITETTSTPGNYYYPTTGVGTYRVIS